MKFVVIGTNNHEFYKFTYTICANNNYKTQATSIRQNIMISRKDNLLIRPWQQRKLEHHRRKVQSALPVIDTSPPAYRGHVAVKLKKKQIENERCEKIERDNYLLLQKMNYIMKTSRIDNYWRSPQPLFLGRIGMYNPVVPQIEDIVFEQQEIESSPRSRKSKCYACTSQKKELTKVPEEKDLWKTTSASRIRSKSVPTRAFKPFTITEDPPALCSKPSSGKFYDRAQRNTKQSLKIPHIKTPILTEPQSITLTRGSLKLSVNFPTDTLVKFQAGNVGKLLVNGTCHCKNSNVAVY